MVVLRRRLVLASRRRRSELRRQPARDRASKQIRLFSRESSEPLWSYEASTWVTKMEFNGDLILAGTGMREFYGEGQSTPSAKVECKEIIQPPPLEETRNQIMRDNGEDHDFPVNTENAAICGNTYCEKPAESHENCPQDCCPESGCVEDDYGEDKEPSAGPSEAASIEPEEVSTEPPIEPPAEQESLLDALIRFLRGLFGA